MSHDGAVVDGVGVWNCGPARYLEVEGFENEFVFFSGGLASAFNRVVDALGKIVFATLRRDDWFVVVAGLAGGQVLNIGDEGNQLGRDENSRKEEGTVIVDAP